MPAQFARLFRLGRHLANAWLGVHRAFAGRKHLEARSRVRGTRLGLETLEDRVVPAFSLSVLNPVVQEGQGFATVTLSRDVSNLQQGEAVNLVWGGTATTMMDYSLSVTDIIFTFAPGESSKSVDVTALLDSFPEGEESVVASVWNGLEQTSVTITIQDAPLPVVSIAATDADASEAGPDTATFVVSVTGSNLLGLSVPVQIGGTASSGTDYSLGGLNGSVITFGPGENSKTIILTPTQDQQSESDETVSLALSSGLGFTVDATAGSASATIHDAGGGGSSAVVTVTAVDAQVLEGDATRFIFERTGDLTGSLSIVVDLSGTAVLGSDYSGRRYGWDALIPLHAGGNGIYFAPGEALARADIWTNSDYETESLETIVMTILPPDPGWFYSYATGTPGSATITILDGPTAGNVVTVSAVDADAYEVGQDTAALLFQRTGDCSQALTVRYTVSGTATNLVDYTGMTVFQPPPDAGIPLDEHQCVVEFAAGQSSVAVIITASQDGADEGGESVVVSLNTSLAGSPSSATVTIHDGSPLYANDDDYSVAHDQALTVAAPGVLDNDDNPANLPLTASLVSGPVHGTVALNSDGSFSYTPDAGWVGIDSFSYSASDGVGGSSSATVSIEVQNVTAPVANSDSHIVIQNGILLFGPSEGVLENDSDADGDILSAQLVSGPSHGTLTLDVNGAFTYEPDVDYIGTDSFAYRASDGIAVSADTIVNLDIVPLPVVTIMASDGSAAEEGLDPGTLLVTRTGSTTEELVVYFAVSGTATEGFDYADLFGMVVIAQGQSSATITITPNNDALQEGTEDVVVILQQDPSYELGVGTSAVVLIADDVSDLGAQISILSTDALATEIDTTLGMFTLTRTGDASAPLTVFYDVGGLALNDIDYQLLGGSVTFATGSSSVEIPVLPFDDFDAEGDETIALTLRQDVSYQVHALFATAMVLLADNPAGMNPSIWILDSTKAGVPRYLRVAKWNGAYTAKDLRNTLNEDIFDKDPDRFHIRVKDPAKAGMASIEIKVSTDSPGSDYDDDPTTVLLRRVAGTTDVFQTEANRAHILVSNRADNELAVDGIDNNDPGDRTHIVALGGTVKVEYGMKSVTASVPVLKKIKVNVHELVDATGLSFLGEPFVDRNGNGVFDAGEVYRDVDGNGAYTARLSKPDVYKRIEYDLAVTNETYTQVGIVFDFSLSAFHAPQTADGVIELSPNEVIGDNNLTAQEKALLLTGHNSAEPDDIELYYVSRLKRAPKGTPLGNAFTSDFYRQMTTADVNDSAFVATTGDIYTIAHEIGHLLLQNAKHPPRYGVNVMSQGRTVINREMAGVKDTKRFTATQQALFLRTKYAKDPG